jgi:hypothetical protein
MTNKPEDFLELSLVPEPVLRWFRRQSKPVQWLTGVPVCVALTGSVAWETFRHRAPGEPTQAIFWTLVLLVVTVVLTELLRPKPNIEDARPAGLGDFQFPTATEGRVVPLLWGKVRVRGPNVVWYGDLQQDAIQQKVKTGLWSSERVIKGFKYHLGVQFAICRGGGTGVALKRVWVGEDEVFNGTITGEGRFDIDEPELFGGNDYGQGGLQSTVDFYPGTTTQSVSAFLDTAARQRITTAATPTAPRYSGTCYLVARQLTSAAPSATDRGAYLGNSTSIKPWSFEVERYPALFSGQAGSQNKVGTEDANPINVIYELLTNTEWGFGFAAADIDVGGGSSFKTAADTMITEGNGFSLFLDRAMQAKDLLEELQRQIDGVVFLDHRTGKWRIKLIRADYVIGSVLQLDETNVKEVRDFTRGSWEDTTNQIQVKFSKRADEYKESYAVAQDMGNAIISAGGSTTAPSVVSASSSYPGVKNAALASQLAWRDLRAQSYPLARVTLVVNRENWSTRIGDVVAWTSTTFGFTQLPLRITRVNYGKPTSNEMTLTCVQDVFKFAVASMGTPPATGWTNPGISLAAFPSNAQLAFEAPRGLIIRDPDYAGDPNISKVLAAARRQGSEVGFQIGQRNAVGVPAGSFAEAGNVTQFVRIGKLSAALNAGTAIPTATITVVPDPDSQVDIESVFDDSSTLADLGVDLVQLILVGTELMLVRSASVSGANVTLANVYRGVLDTAQENHAINAPVYLLFVGAGLTDTTFPNTNNVDIELRMRSSSEVWAGAVTTIGLTMAKRAMRPYPPNASLYNGSGTAFGAMNVDADGSGMNGSGANVAWRRRDYRTTDEVTELLSDNAAVDGSTEYRVRVFVNPDTTNVEVLTSAWATGVGPVFLNRLLLWDEAAAGAEIRVRIEARHDILTEVDLTSRNNLIHDLVPTSAYDALFYLGGKLQALVNSNSYPAVATGTFTLRIGAAYASSAVQVSINGAAFATVIAAGLTSGTFSVSSGDTIRVRHTVNQTPSPNLVQLEDPSAVIVAYGVLKT